MLKYKIKGGDVIEAPDFETLTRALQDLDQTPYPDVQTYMKATAHACGLSTGATIRTKDAETFIADLEKNGFIIKAD